MNKGDRTMKDSAVAPETADPYAALEAIIKITGRSWLTEEWRLEDIRFLAQEAIATRGRMITGNCAGTAVQPQITVKTSPRPRSPARRSERIPS